MEGSFSELLWRTVNSLPAVSFWVARYQTTGPQGGRSLVTPGDAAELPHVIQLLSHSVTWWGPGSQVPTASPRFLLSHSMTSFSYHRQLRQTDVNIQDSCHLTCLPSGSILAKSLCLQSSRLITVWPCCTCFVTLLYKLLLTKGLSSHLILDPF